MLSALRRYRLLFLMLIALIPIMSGFVALSNRIPAFDSGEVWTEIIADGSTACVSINCSDFSDLFEFETSHTDEIVIDLESGAVHRAIDRPIALCVHHEKQSDQSDTIRAHWLVPSDQSTPFRFRDYSKVDWVTTDLMTGRELVRFPFETSFDGVPIYILVNDQFYVERSNSNIQIYDVRSKTPYLKRYPIDHPGFHLQNVFGANHFTIASVQPSAKSAPTLYCIDADGNIGLMGQLAGASRYEEPRSVQIGGELKLATMDVDVRHIQLRSLDDGSIEYVWPIPTAFSNDEDEWKLAGQHFVYSDGTHLRVINWVENRNVHFTRSSDRYPQLSGHLLSYQIDEEIEFLDLRSGKVIGGIPDTNRPKYFDEKQAILVSAEMGTTFTTYDIRSGQLSKRLQPFAFAIPTLIMLIAVFAAWSAAWLVMSSRTELPVWIDQFIIAGVPFALLAYRAETMGWSGDADRIVYQYALGIAIAAFVVTNAWIIFGKTRLLLRLLPLFGTFTLFALALSILFRNQDHLAWSMLAKTIISASLAAIALGLLRLFGPKLSQSNDRLCPNQSIFSIRDLLVITLFVSAGIGASQPIFQDAELKMNVMPAVTPTVILIVVATYITVASFSQRRWLSRSATLVAVIVAVFLLIDQTFQFATGENFSTFRDVVLTAPYRVVLTCSVAMFVLLIPYRMRGWRWYRSNELLVA